MPNLIYKKEITAQEVIETCEKPHKTPKKAQGAKKTGKVDKLPLPPLLCVNKGICHSYFLDREMCQDSLCPSCVVYDALLKSVKGGTKKNGQ